jgi:plasmid stabilization system protein ParE
MPHSVRITARALREIDEALDWLIARSRPAALRWHQRLTEAIRSLEDHPERCPFAPEEAWYQGSLRQLLHGRRRGTYRLLFEIRGDTVYVLRVRHGAQALLEPGEL